MKHFSLLVTLLLIASVRIGTCGEPLSLGKFLENLDAQNPALKRTLLETFDASASSDVRGEPREIVGNAVISEFRFEAWPKGSSPSGSDMILFLRVAGFYHDKDGKPQLTDFGASASVDRRLVGYRVEAAAPSGVASR